jgi:hypothetical protein
LQNEQRADAEQAEDACLAHDLDWCLVVSVSILVFDAAK